MSELSDMTPGLDLPGDAETLAGDSVALALGTDFDPETFFNSGDGSDIPVAGEDQGRPRGDRRRPRQAPRSGGPGGEPARAATPTATLIAIGPNADYRPRSWRTAASGDTAVFKDVVREADKASAVLFVNFDAGDGWSTPPAATRSRSTTSSRSRGSG